MSVRPAGIFGAVLILLLAAAALVAGAASVCPGGACQPTGTDRLILALLDAQRQPWLDALFRGVTWLGSIAVLLPLALLLAWRYRQRGMRGAAPLLLGSLAGAWLFARMGKLLVDRPRPDLHPTLVEMPADLSFPSAHAMQVAAFALAWALAPGMRRTLAQLAAAAAAVLLVALSRLYLQVHYPSDVLFGLIAAAAWVLGLHLLLAERAAAKAQPSSVPQPPNDREPA